MRIFVFLCIFMGLAGCVSQSINKVSGISKGEEICVVRNPAVSQDFFDAYSNTLRNVGLVPRPVESAGTCDLYTTYSAQFGMHWGLYLARARLEVFKDGESIGSATYKAPRADPTKHGKVEGKIQKLVDDLFSSAKT